VDHLKREQSRMMSQAAFLPMGESYDVVPWGNNSFLSIETKGEMDKARDFHDVTDIFLDFMGPTIYY